MSDTPTKDIPEMREEVFAEGWPTVAANDDGIRPAGPSDECFYCQRRVGEPHGVDCVIVQKRVRVRYAFELDISVPHFWDAEQLLFHRNDGTWCADNALDALQELRDESGCLCNAFTCEYLGISDNSPRRSVRITPDKPIGAESSARTPTPSPSVVSPMDETPTPHPE